MLKQEVKWQEKGGKGKKGKKKKIRPNLSLPVYLALCSKYGQFEA